MTLSHVRRRLCPALAGLSLLLASALGAHEPDWRHYPHADSYFIGDHVDTSGHDDVKRFDERTNTYLGEFAPQRMLPIYGPAGMIVTNGELILVNQNANQPSAGEVLRFDARTGYFRGKLVSSTDRNAPFAPRGIVRGGPYDDYYVADLGLAQGCASDGEVKQYNAWGGFAGNLNRRRFMSEYHPRGVVFGPDGLLYVSVVSCLDPTDPFYKPGDRGLGYILRFDPRSKRFIDVFASHVTVPKLHRPEGLAFDDEGNLWVTSFVYDDPPDGVTPPADNVDRILKLDGRTGRQTGEIPLWQAPGARAYAQAFVFGPGGDLYIPISGNDPTTAGEVLRCDPKSKTRDCDVIVPAGSGAALTSPQYIIFRESNPATLRYAN